MKKSNFIRLTSAFALTSLLAIGTAACSNNQDSSSKSSSSSAKSSVSSKTSSTQSKAEKTVNETKTKVKVAKIKISQTEALNTFSKSYSNKKIKNIDLKTENGNYVYEIEGFDATKEYNMTIDANNGKVIHKYTEKLDLDDHLQKGLDFDKTINRNQASKIAEKHVGSDTSKEWNLEQDGTNAYWEVTVDDGTKQIEVKINAINKHVVNSEHDDDDD